MRVVRAGQGRRSETPAAVMTTLASPSVGGAATAIWRVEVAPAAPPGPAHVINAEQVWTFLSGGATVEVSGQAVTAGAGDTIVIPGDHVRKVTGDAESGFSAIVTAAAGAGAALPGATEYKTPPWIA